MCHHFIGFSTYDRLPKPRALWRCSTCGRESRTPIDCCVRPAFAVLPQTGIGTAVSRWLRAVASQAVTGLATMWQRRRSTELRTRTKILALIPLGDSAVQVMSRSIDICPSDAPEAYLDMEADPLLLEADTDTADLEETTQVSV